MQAGQVPSRRRGVPLFARFLVDSGGRFSRVILTTVPKVFTSETLRRIEAVTGNLKDRGDITVIVHDAFFVAGSLDVCTGYAKVRI